MDVRFFAVVALALSLLTACAQTKPSKPEASIDPNADIPAYKTFGWQPTQNTLVSTDVTQRKFDESIRAAIATDLTRKGYAETATDPDFTVAYEVVAYEATKSSPFSVGVGMGSWGGNVGTSVGVGTGGSSKSVQETRLNIRAADRKADKEVWVGTMTSGIAPGASPSDVNGVVTQTLKDFPARRP